MAHRKKKLTRAGRFMKGRDLLRSAFKATLVRACWAGAKAEADAERRAARAAYFIIVELLVENETSI